MSLWGEAAEIIVRSVYVSASAVALASLWCIPLSVLTVMRSWTLVARIAESLVGIPTVLVGLLLYMLLSRSGPLGFLGLLYTPQAIIIGESILVTPLFIALCVRGLRHTYLRIYELALSLGADEISAHILALRESLHVIISAALASFSRAIGELGVALMLGGNIRGYTRTITTAIALEVSKGEYELAILLGLVLVTILAIVAITVYIAERVIKS
ncbi:ABC-type tungstate transport system, periplasmic component, TupA [Pyrolobus fumarii 1A]|uniref:ABC-type tungstate transport system, periplasmic component, TupA n=1 Tax=Pyrolobus fumarii (strain DSM 11204 / 1A) TaxID=694429 RepID=G0EEA0_PYRF1|nr:ABC transporter permease [Pyrolobus fumarii]AEM38794.1 ABC-type tungstate transport system, periplasmic component, TupA [Pyrolobus fumarii 1A]